MKILVVDGCLNSYTMDHLFDINLIKISIILKIFLIGKDIVFIFQRRKMVLVVVYRHVNKAQCKSMATISDDDIKRIIMFTGLAELKGM